MTPSAPRLFTGLLFAARLCLPLPISAQPIPASAHPKPARTFSISPRRQLRPGVDAFPAILAPHSPAAERVNATLDAMNKQLLDSLRECDNVYLRTHRPKSNTATKRPLPVAWERRISVTMKGPRLLAMIADDLQFCGNSYPNRDRAALVFDMDAGGQPVDWRSLMTESAEAVPASDSSLDGAPSSSLVMPALTEMAVSRAGPECKRAFNPQGDLTFLVWPDAKRGRIVAQATGLPHGVQACQTEIALTPEQARQAGFGDQFLALIEQAHRITAIARRPSR
jgi:hypothetical protein